MTSASQCPPSRNMVRAGVSERVAMLVGGHKTRSDFDRYHIAAPGDLGEAAKPETRQQEEREALKKSGAGQFGQSSGRNIASGTRNDAATENRPTSTVLPN